MAESKPTLVLDEPAPPTAPALVRVHFQADVDAWHPGDEREVAAGKAAQLIADGFAVACS